MPMMLAALLHYWRRPTTRNAILFGLCVLMNGLTNIHQFLFGTTAIVLSIALLALLTTRFKWRTLIGAALATILAVALMIPVLLPYKEVSELYGMVRDRNTAMWGSAIWTDWLSANVRNRAYGNIADPANVRPEAVLFPGLMMLFLTASALLIDRRKLPVALDARPVPRWLLHLLDAIIIAMAIGTYIGAATRNYQWRLLGHTIVSFHTTSKPASSDVPLVILIVMIFVRLSLQLPKGLSGETLQSLRTVAARSRPRGQRTRRSPSARARACCETSSGGRRGRCVRTCAVRASRARRARSRAASPRSRPACASARRRFAAIATSRPTNLSAVAVRAAREPSR
jgi:hypothetical protein